MVSHQPANFDDNRHCGSGDVIVLDCHMILRDHMTKGLSNCIGGSNSRYVTILPTLVAIGTVLMEI